MPTIITGDSNTDQFTDRVSEFPNRRKITIVSQTPYEIVADITRFDNPEANKEGTPINADNLNNVIEQAAEDATSNLKQTLKNELLSYINSITNPSFILNGSTLEITTEQN